MQPAHKQAPHPDDHPDFRYIGSLGGITEYRLEANGLRVLHMPAHAAPVVVLMLTYEVGSRHETAGLLGASHMLEHMMFKGTARFNKQRGNSLSELVNALGGQTNATTWLDRTNYFSLLPREHLEPVVEIEADRMRNIRIAPAELEAEKTVVLNEYDQCTGDPLEKLNQAVWGAAFGEHPYGAPVIGSRDDIRGYTREGLLVHYHAHYGPNNATVTVVGDVDARSVLDIVGRHFGCLPRNDAVAAADKAIPAQHGERRVVVDQAGQPGWVMLACKVPKGPDADAMEVMGSVLADGKLSKLYRPLVGSGLAIAAYAGMSRLRQQGLFQVQALLGSAQDHTQVEQLMRESIAAIARDGVSQQDVDRARGRMRGILLTSRDGPLEVAMQLSEAIAAGDWTAYTTASERIATVTPADVQRVAGKYLADAYLTVGHLRQ